MFYLIDLEDVEPLHEKRLDFRKLPFIAPALSDADRPNPDFIEAILLQRIWSELFGYEVGVYADFFELGGYSLLLISMIERINACFDIQFVYELLPEKITIDAVAKLIVLVKIYQKQYFQASL